MFSTQTLAMTFLYRLRAPLVVEVFRIHVLFLVSVSRRAFLKQGRKAVPSSKSKGPSTDGKRERSYIGLGTENFQ